MKNLKYESLVDFSEAVIDVYGMLDEFGDISVIAKYEEARALLSILAIDFDIVSVELHHPDFCDYYAEYIISLNSDGIWVQPFMIDGKYITDESVVTFVLDNCSSVCLPYCKSHLLFEVAIDEMDEECVEIECEGCPYGDCNCDECDDLSEGYKSKETVSFEYDEDMHGFTVGKGNGDSNCFFSFHTTETLDHDDMIKIAKLFGY